MRFALSRLPAQVQRFIGVSKTSTLKTWKAYDPDDRNFVQILSAFSRDFGRLRRTPFHISSDMPSTNSKSSSQEPSNKGALLGQLEAAVTAQQAAFCCGGTIQIAAARDCIYEHTTVDTKPLVSPPVVVRWDLPSGKAIRKLTLPAVQKAESTPAISELLESCSPATFGHKGHDVLDQ